MSDFMRTNLVFRLRCAKCGRTLRLTYDPKRKDSHLDTGELDDDCITVAEKVMAEAYVHPCETCYGDARRPLDMLKAALAAAEKEKEEP